MKSTCRYCYNWHNVEEKDDEITGDSFLVGNCSRAESSFDVRDMKPDEIAVGYGHDGPISFGQNFGCLHFVGGPFDVR